ncbi:MAG: cobalt transporter CbiM [Desulfobacteraceae bacterium]|nr:cobalt transporter CbiM [Desulfobacteraceae bacterium]
MHISEGVLSAPVLISGAILAAGGTAIGLKQLDYEKIARVGILSSAFFIAALIHVNIGPSSVHLVLNGLIGLMLGWSVFPAILTALVLQALFFQFGGITTLGINTFNLALPPLLCYFMFRKLLWRRKHVGLAAAFLCGFLSVFLSAILVGASLIFTEKNFWETASILVAANFPVMVIDGIITGFCVGFIQKVHPSLLPGYNP